MLFFKSKKTTKAFYSAKLFFRRGLLSVAKRFRMDTASLRFDAIRLEKYSPLNCYMNPDGSTLIASVTVWSAEFVLVKFSGTRKVEAHRLDFIHATVPWALSTIVPLFIATFSTVSKEIISERWQQYSAEDPCYKCDMYQLFDQRN